VSGSAGRFAVAPGTEPVRALLVLDPPSATTGQCAELAFPGPPPAPACTFSAAWSGPGYLTLASSADLTGLSSADVTAASSADLTAI
jgi:hypothetical protein